MPGLSVIKGYQKEWFTKDLAAGLSVASIALAIARAKKEFSTMLDRTGIAQKIGRDNFFNSVREGVEYYQRKK